MHNLLRRVDMGSLLEGADGTVNRVLAKLSSSLDARALMELFGFLLEDVLNCKNCCFKALRAYPTNSVETGPP